MRPAHRLRKEKTNVGSTKQPEEVQILRFFETAPIERVQAVYNIVSEKVRVRTPNRPGSPRPQRAKKGEKSALPSGEREQAAPAREGER